MLARADATPQEVTGFAHGMTVATNALLEGRAARTALIATAGFTDVIELGRQARVHLYRLCDAAPAPLVAPELRFAAPERCGPDGPLLALDPAERGRPCRGDRRGRARGGGRRAAALLCLSRARAPTRAPAHRAPGAGHARIGVERAGGHVPRVRAHGHDRARRRPEPARGLLSAPAGRRGLRAGARGAGDHAVLGRARLDGPCGRARGPDGPLRTRRRRGRRATAGRAGGRGERAVLRHGRHLLRRLPDHRRTGRRDRAAHRRRSAAGAAGARHPHGRRGRRLDRLARWRRRAARGSRVGGRDARTGLLRTGRRAGDGHRREPAVGATARREAAGGLG